MSCVLCVCLNENHITLENLIAVPLCLTVTRSPHDCSTWNNAYQKKCCYLSLLLLLVLRLALRFALLLLPHHFLHCYDYHRCYDHYYCIIIISSIMCYYRCLWTHIPFRWAFALQSIGRNCSPAPDLALRGPIFSKGPLVRRSLFFTDTGIIITNAITLK